MARTVKNINAYRILVGNLEEKNSFEGLVTFWEDNIKVDREEMGWEGEDWINLAQNKDRW